VLVFLSEEKMKISKDYYRNLNKILPPHLNKDGICCLLYVNLKALAFEHTNGKGEAYG